jgi:leader peptidase (prepilin peptidase)/N-methyltransferase
MTGIEIVAFVGACLIATLVGLAAGALVNTLADRVVGVDEPIWSATQCRKCGAPLPAASFIALGELATPRVCGTCGKRASLRRPLTQIALALAFPLLLAHALLNPGHPFSRNATVLPVWALVFVGVVSFTALAFTFVVDLEHRLIYDLAIFPPLALILGAAALFNPAALPSLLLAGGLAGGLFLLLYALGWAIYRQEALGFGDVKLAALMGVAVGWPAITTAIAITVAGGFIIALLLLASGASDRRAYIPFGVFMVLATAITLLTSPFPW